MSHTIAAVSTGNQVSAIGNSLKTLNFNDNDKIKGKVNSTIIKFLV